MLTETSTNVIDSWLSWCEVRALDTHVSVFCGIPHSLPRRHLQTKPVFLLAIWKPIGMAEINFIAPLSKAEPVRNKVCSFDMSTNIYIFEVKKPVHLISAGPISLDSTFNPSMDGYPLKAVRKQPTF
jgi:hypothetical protein